MALWVVREGSQGQNEQFALENGVSAIGWDEVPDVNSFKSRDELSKFYEEQHPDDSKSRVASYVGQLWSFAKSIKIGDIIALPLKTRGTIALGKVTGDYEHLPDNPWKTTHTRKVEWVRDDVPKTDVGQDLLYSLGSFRTVCQIQRNNAEERIRAVMNGQKDPELITASIKVSADPDVDETDIEEPETDLEQFARDQIIKLIEARFKGHDLANLVRALLEAQGYKTLFSPPGPDGGIDILAGKGSLGFDQPRLCVQVKSGSTSMDVSTIRELEGVMGRVGAEQGLFVSWGGFTGPVYKESRNTYFKVRLWNAEDLIEAILEHYEKLPEEIQTELPLKRIWVIVPQER